MENVPSVGRSGRRRKGQDLEVESSGLGKAKAKGGRVYGGELDMGMGLESSMLDGASSYSPDPFGRALGSSPRRRQERQVEEEVQDHDDGMEIDLDADVPDADDGVDLDADVPDMDADAGHGESASDEEDEQEEEDVVLHTSNIDTSGIDVDMDTPTAPTRGHQQRPPIAAATRRSRAAPPPPPPAPPALTRPSRRTRTQQQPSRPMGYDGASDYPLPQTRPPQPPLFAQSQTRAAQPHFQQPALPSLAGRVAEQRYRHTAQSSHRAHTHDDHANNDDDAETLETPLEQYQSQHPANGQQPQTQAETELQRRRRIQEETIQVAERERARRARIMGQGQARSQVGGTSQQVGSYGGVPGAPARGVVATRPASRR